MPTKLSAVLLICAICALCIGCGAKEEDSGTRSAKERPELAPLTEPEAEQAESKPQPALEPPAPAYSTNDLLGTWDFIPSQEQEEFASLMGKKAGPLKYTFTRGGTYKAAGGPLSGNDYVEDGLFEFDGAILVLHRKGVGGTRAPIYERTKRHAIRFENEGGTFVGDKEFGNWAFAGEEARFGRL